MKIVFIVTSFWSYGELLIAREFADQIADDNEILFLIPPSHRHSLGNNYKYVTLIPHSRNINRILINEISQKFQPELVILSDFLNYAFADRQYGIIREDLDIFRCPLATFDNFDWKLKRKRMDTYGFKSNIPKKVNVNDYGWRIIPCPLGNPDGQREDEHRFAMFNRNISTPTQSEKLKAKKRVLGTVDERPVILISNAKWQEEYVKNAKIDKFIEASNRLFDELVLKLSQKFLIISIGEKRNSLSSCSNITMVDSVPARVFDDYITMSDLYIGKNITSTSMIKMALSGMACVNIINSYSSWNEDFPSIVKKECSDINGMYKFMMYPVGWYDFLYPVLENNLYKDIIQFCELFEFDKTIKMIEKMLFIPELQTERNYKLIALKKKLSQLNSPKQIIESIADRK